jgi:hypothetical protein
MLEIAGQGRLEKLSAEFDSQDMEEGVRNILPKQRGASERKLNSDYRFNLEKSRIASSIGI